VEAVDSHRKQIHESGAIDINRMEKQKEKMAGKKER
jgi:hypothetical protein